MFVYEKPGEGSPPPIIERRGEAQSGPPPDIAKQISELGIQIDPETFGRIQADGQDDSLRRDLTAALTNPSERPRIEQMYLKGYGQIVEVDGKQLSFAEIARMNGGEKDRVLQQIGRTDRVKFKEYELQAANQRIKQKQGVEQAANQTEKKIDGNIQAANQRIEQQRETARRLDKELQSSTDQIRTLSSLPRDIEARAMKEAATHPPKNIANIPTENRGEYKNLILAEYAISHRAEIMTQLSVQDQERFSKAIKNAGDVLGYSVENFGKLVESKVLGSGRDQVESRGRELIEKGYNQEVLWNNRDRTITFTNKDGEVRVIETDRIPPREYIEKGGLRIGRDITKLSPEEQKKRSLKEKTEIALKETTENRDQAKEQFWNTRREEYTDTALYSTFVGENRAENTAYEQLEMQYANGNLSSEEIPNTLERMITLTEKMRQTNATRYLEEDLTPGDRERISTMLEKRKYQLTALKREEQNLNNIDRKQLEYTPKDGRTERWEEQANGTLSTLNDLGFSRFGQERWETFLEAWNYEHRDQKTYQLALDQDPTLSDITRRELDSYMDTKFGARGAKRNEGIQTFLKKLSTQEATASQWARSVEARSRLLFGENTETSPQETPSATI